MAASTGKYNIADLLVSNGCDLGYRDDDGRSLLHLAAADGSVEAISYFRKHKVSPEVLNENGEPPIFTAIRNNNIDCIHGLLKKGDLIPYGRDTTALHVAIEKENVSMLKELLKYNPPIDKPDKDGLSPLMCAASKNNKEIIKILLDNGADVNYQNENNYDYNALCIAANEGSNDVIELLVKSGCKIDMSTKDGFSPLAIALLSQMFSTAEILLKNGANIDFQDEATGKTALHFCAEDGLNKSVQFLLKNGASKTIRDLDSKTAVELAEENGHDKLVSLIEGTKKSSDCCLIL